MLTIALTATICGAEICVDFDAFATDTRMAIGQVAAGDRESEIIAARTRLRLLDLKGVLVTGDALHCQGGTAALIQERGGDWLFTLKANRPAQHKEVAAWFADPHARPEMAHVTTDADHGRIEVRRHVVSHDVCCPTAATPMRPDGRAWA